jgi:hypothetical protein
VRSDGNNDFTKVSPYRLASNPNSAAPIAEPMLIQIAVEIQFFGRPKTAETNSASFGTKNTNASRHAKLATTIEYHLLPASRTIPPGPFKQKRRPLDFFN